MAMFFKRPRSWQSRSLLLMCATQVLALGCEEEKPYTPFEVATSLPEEGSAPKKPAPRPRETATKPKLKKPLRAPAGSTRWRAFGRTLVAPQQSRFEIGLQDPTAESDLVVAWVFPQKRSQSRASSGLWTFGKDGRTRTQILPLPDFMPRSSDCDLQGALSATGPQTLTAELTVSCDSELLDGSPTRSLAVVAPSSPSPLLLHFSLSDGSPGEKLTLQVDSSDRDDDGADDIELQASLRAPSGKTESLPFRWLVRTAGASRVSESPQKEVTKRAARLLISSVRKAERGDAPQQVEALRRLLTAVCEEFGKPRLLRASGEALSCGQLAKPLGQLAQVNVQSYLGQNQLVRALGAYEQAKWFGKNPSIPSDLAGTLQPKIAEKPARKLARFRLEVAKTASPHRTPLTFDDSGQLWAVTPEKTKRLTMEGDPPLVTPETDDEPEKRIEPPKWSIESKSASGDTLRATIPSCERAEVLVALGSGTKTSTFPLPLLAPRPGDCGGFAPQPLPAEPLFWKGGALAVAVAGELLYSRGNYRPPSAPVAWNTSLGLAVLQGEELSLWTGSVTKGLHHCAVNAEGSRVACVDEKGVSVLTVDEEEPGESTATP